VKLLIADLDCRRTYVSRELWYTMTALTETHGWRFLEANTLRRAPGTLEDQLARSLGEQPAVLLFWECFDLICAHRSSLERLDGVTCVFAEDLHGSDEIARAEKVLSFLICDVILAAYPNAFADLYPRLWQTRRVLAVPHAASQDFDLPFNEDAVNAVFLSGALGHHYPLRQRMASLSRNPTLAIVHHPHPGYHCSYDYATDPRIGRSYALKIQEYRAGFTDCALYRYVLAKHFEIPATGALLLAERAVQSELAELGLLDGVHYVSVSHDDLEDRLRYVLDPANHDELDPIRRRGQALIRQRHTTADRAALIDRLCSR
jgi:hypothetical protein